MKGIDFQFCKGCLKCVVICPKQALTRELESNHDVVQITQKLFSDADKVQNQK
jgi:pyruvate ferredoxin oxidoreductase gamma subunit